MFVSDTSKCAYNYGKKFQLPKFFLNTFNMHLSQSVSVCVH